MAHKPTDAERILKAMVAVAGRQAGCSRSGIGCNILNYLTTAPIRITAIDLNPASSGDGLVTVRRQLRADYDGNIT